MVSLIGSLNLGSMHMGDALAMPRRFPNEYQFLFREDKKWA